MCTLYTHYSFVSTMTFAFLTNSVRGIVRTIIYYRQVSRKILKIFNVSDKTLGWYSWLNLKFRNFIFFLMCKYCLDFFSVSRICRIYRCIIDDKLPFICFSCAIYRSASKKWLQCDINDYFLESRVLSSYRVAQIRQGGSIEFISKT